MWFKVVRLFPTTTNLSANCTTLTNAWAIWFCRYPPVTHRMLSVFCCIIIVFDIVLLFPLNHIHQRSGSIKVSLLVDADFFHGGDTVIQYNITFTVIIKNSVVSVCMYVSVMYRTEKWINGQKMRYIGFTKTYRANERYILKKCNINFTYNIIHWI